ncbi:MAG: calcium-binding protein [Nocardioides sp.]
MRAWPTRLALASVLVGSLVSVGAPASNAAPTVGGREWRELYETTGLSWTEIASVCPTDGATACSGTVRGRNLTGWTWATASQVRDLLDDYAPGLTTAEPPVVSGIDGFWAGISFLAVMRWTTYTSSTYSYSESTSGWTASQDAAAGLPIGGFAAYSHQLAGTTATGSIGLGTAPDAASSVRGVWLWRPAGVDYTAPVVTPTVAGTLGNNGWYRSNVSVSWAVTDSESPITSRVGCDPSTLATDSGGTAYACTATSAGGQGSGSVTVKRDATPPTISCGPPPTFELGSTSTVGAVVTDSLSGPPSASISRLVSTATVGTFSAVLTATDLAGNLASQSCGYSVVAPKCQGLTPTIRGTAGNDVIRGTAAVDVIHGFGGADRIDGLGAGDKLCGGDGVDVIQGGDGADTVDGGAGNDDISGGPAADDLNGGAGSDSIRGDDGADRCTSGEVRMSSCAVIY